MSSDKAKTKILFIDDDEHSFAIKQCIANALMELPPVELYHANDATEALTILDRESLDVIVLDDNLRGELELLIDSLNYKHPAILCQTNEEIESKSVYDDDVTFIEKNESLEGLHKTLLIATSVRSKSISGKKEGLH